MIKCTIKTTKHGVFSTEYSSSLGVNHVTFSHSSSGYNKSNALKLKVGNGRYTIDFHMGFQNASTSDVLKFRTYIPSGSTITSIKNICVNGKQILGEVSVKQGSWVEINAGALGATSGYITFEYYSSKAASNQYFYIDDVRIEGKGSSSSSGSSSSGSSSSSSSSSSSGSSSSSSAKYINMGYLPYYRTSVYKNLDYDALTHMCLAFFNPDASSLEITHKFDSTQLIKDIIKKAHDNGVKVLASYGGASGKSAYTQIMTSTSKIEKLVDKMIQHALDYDFDGIDIDIEASESYTEIWNNYGTFISLLRERCDEEGLLLTTAVAEWYGDAISSSTLKKFDIVGVMAYDDGGANHSTYDMAVDMVEYFVSRGVSKSKIVMGVPFYGYKTNTDREGELTYKEILAKDSSAYNKDLSNGMAYNGIPTIKKKCQFVKDNGYGGIMIWELGQDATETKYSLLNAIKETLYGSSGAR